MTPHNNAKKGDIAKTVLMPGDPLRAKVIAEKYLTNPVCFNTVRNMFGYTGEYKGVKVSVMGSGMGMPSIGIYSYELYTQYEVENIIRIGSAGGMAEGVKLRDLIFAAGACTDSNYASQYKLPGTFSPTASFNLLRTAVEEAEKLGVEYKVGNMLSSDCFYNDNTEANAAWIKMGVLAVEMEAAALYMNAARLKKNALAMCTVSDLVDGSASLSAEDRQNTFNDMMVVALETAIKL
ncbi:MAG: purine-nucleoside phosphorylase [Clostridia bacterium]|nr:purine-nucleoside phosphorylase [Clostridia bacterium]